MPKYSVRFTAIAEVESYVDVDADNANKAAELAMHIVNNGGCVWLFQGNEDDVLMDEPVEVR